MAVLTPGQLAWLAGRYWPTFGGVPSEAAVTAVAVALAESGGDTDAHNANPATGDDSYGLWQINMLGDLGPARRARFKLASNAELLNPVTNADVAHQLSGAGSSWSPWSTYRSGRYRQNLERAREGFRNPDSNIPGVTRVPFGPGQAADLIGGALPDPLASVGEAAANVAEMVADAARWIGDRSNWARIVFVALGGVVAALALAIVARPAIEDTVTSTVTSTAQKVSPL